MQEVSILILLTVQYITHLKYNIVVQSQSERSQHRNKDTAMKMLKSRYEIELDKKMKKKKEESNKSR